MKKIYYVGVYLNSRVNFGPLGFTSYVFCYTMADNINQARENAKLYFEKKYQLQVTGTRPNQLTKAEFEKYTTPDCIIGPGTEELKQTLFQN